MSHEITMIISLKCTSAHAMKGKRGKRPRHAPAFRYPWQQPS